MDAVLEALSTVLEQWCTSQELDYVSADDLQTELIRERDRMWKNHEDDEQINAQLEWLRAYIELWDATNEAA